jgi:DNA-binding NarL/FixJ family response regulator
LRLLVVVEDEADVRMLIKLRLAADPRIEIVGEAESAAQAIELARVTHPALVILDHSIEGDIMGLQAAPMLKEVSPETKILLFTAYDMRSEAEHEPAVDAFLSKRDFGKLLQTVQHLLELHDPAA